MPYLKINYDYKKPMLEKIYLPSDPRAWLDACYKALSCSIIETTSTVIPDVVLVLDEEGKLCDGWQHRINRVATYLGGKVLDPIVGDAILARVDGDNLVPLTFSDIDLVYRLKRFFS